MHTAPILIVRIYTAGVKTGEVGYHGYTEQRFGTGIR